MATRPKSVKEDFLKCRMCLEIFTDPRILTCLHTYCFRCLKSRVDKTKPGGPLAVCPECQEHLPDEVNSLPVNVFIHGLAEVKRLNTSTMQQVVCTACKLQGKDSEAEVMCLDCGDRLCSTCSDGHNSSTMTWTHVKVALDEVRKGTYNEKLRGLYLVKCQKHKDLNRDYYCVECSELLCISCKVSSHRKHTYLPVSEAAVEKRSSITIAVTCLQRSMADIVSEETRVKCALDAFTTQKRKESDQIKSAAARKISEINRRKTSDLAALTAETNRVQSQKNVELQAVRLKKGRLSGCLSLCEQVLEHGKEEEIVVTEKIIRSKLDQLVRHNSVVTHSPHKVLESGNGLNESEIEPDKCRAISDVASSIRTQEKSPRQSPYKKVLESGNARKESEIEPDKCRAISDWAISVCLHDQEKVPEVENGRKESEIEPDKCRNILEAGGCEASVQDVTASHDKLSEAKQVDSIPKDPRTKEVSKQTIANVKKSTNISHLLFKFTANYTSDKDIPDIKAIVFSSHIGLIIADWRNYKLKIFNTYGELTREIKMKDFQPLSVAVVRNVIASTSANYLWLFSPSGTLNTKVKVTDTNPDKPFRLSLAGSTSIGFVVGQPWKKEFFVFNTIGELMKTLTFSIYFPLVFLSISPRGNFVVSEWGGSGIGVISEEGKRKFQIHYEKWKPNGTCVNSDGTIFISDHNWGGVCVYAEDGHLVQEYDSQFDGLRNPTCLTVDNNSQLYVVDKQGVVFVYKIKPKK